MFNTHFRNTLFLLLMVLSSTLRAADFEWAPAFPVGSAIPLLEAPDQNGKAQTLGSLTGQKGLVLVISRSFSWCPFCKAQLVNLVKVTPQIEATGFKIATLTYDPIETLKEVEEDQDTRFPLLHDEAVKHVDAFKIRNMDYKPGDFAYGIPQPGIMILSPEGKILRKFAEENFRVRPDFADVIAALQQL